MDSGLDGDTGLTTVDADLFDGLTKLKHLYLSHNQLTALPSDVFEGLSSLQTLQLYRNGLTTLPIDTFDDLSSLTTLDISQNRIGALPADPFDGLSRLTYLNLRSNSITALPSNAFKDMSSLRSLLLDDNKLSTLPKGVFSDLTSLKTLYLHDNQISTLPGGIFSGLSSLEHLSLRGNPGVDFTLTAELERQTDGAIVVNIREATPFPINVWLSATGGTLSDSVVRMSGGTSTSETVHVTPQDNQPSVTISFESIEIDTRGKVFRYDGVRFATGDSRTVTTGSGQPDETAPTIASVDITSDPGSDDTYGVGDRIEITVTFSEDVIVTGSPQLELDVGGTAKTANYSSTSGAGVEFVYTVQENDADSDGIAVGADNLSLNEGTIQDAAANEAVLTHVALAANDGHKVDGVHPTVASIAITSDPGSNDTYGVGDNISVTVTFSEDVIVTGSPRLELDVGGTAKTASYSSASGAAVMFVYTAQENDADSDGIALGANKLSLNGGRIRDGAANAATITHAALPDDNGHKADGSLSQTDETAPTIASVAITSDPGSDDTYRTGDDIEVTLTFSEGVSVTGSPQLELSVGGTARTASYSKVSGAAVAFVYTVQENDADSDGISLGANKLSLNGGTIQDAAGNPATLTHNALPANNAHRVVMVVPPAELGGPSGLTATPGDGMVTLSWTAGANSTIHWIAGIKQSDWDNGDYGNIIYEQAESNTGHVVTDLANGTQYAFTVAAGQAQDNGSTKWSAWHATMTATPIAPVAVSN